jgi:hypothetical protein
MKLKKIFMTTLENPLRTKKKKKTEEIIKMHSVFMSTISFFF